MPPSEIPSVQVSDKSLSIQDAGYAAALNLERINKDSGPAAASDKLRAEFLASAQSPTRDAAHQTQLDYELNKLEIDEISHGDLTLQEVATIWGMNLLQNQGGIDQKSLQQIAETGQTQRSVAGADSPEPDPFAMAMAGELNRDWKELSGMGTQR